MNINIAKKRYQDVFRVDSIAVNDWDFMATHIPFKQIGHRKLIPFWFLEKLIANEN